MNTNMYNLNIWDRTFLHDNLYHNVNPIQCDANEPVETLLGRKIHQI